MSEERMHGDRNVYHSERWCAECKEWVNNVNWLDHRDCGDYRVDDL